MQRKSSIRRLGEEERRVGRAKRRRYFKKEKTTSCGHLQLSKMLDATLAWERWSRREKALNRSTKGSESRLRESSVEHSEFLALKNSKEMECSLEGDTRPGEEVLKFGHARTFLCPPGNDPGEREGAKSQESGDNCKVLDS